VTDAGGHFRLTGLTPGRYNLHITRIGYRERRVESVVADTAGVPVRVTLSALPVSLDPIVVTPSRSAQSVLDAPAATSVVERQDVEQATAFTAVDRIREVTGVDFASKGLMQHTFAVRGDRSANSGALLFLTDHRLAAVPSIGFDVPYLIPATSEDVDRIEVTRGPGAALYGPNSDRGVVHVITRSPFESQGASLSLTAGERSVWQGSTRYAATLGARLGFKVSAEYFRGTDWAFTDSTEAANRDSAIAHGADPGTLRIGRRDSLIERAGGEAHVEWRPAQGTALVGTFGIAQAIRNVDLTPDVGAVQAGDWRSSFVQGRFRTGRLTVNLNYNWSDAGQTYLLRTGAGLVDQSRLLSGNVQHSASIGPSTFLYGLDARSTDPRTSGTIHGRNEDNDRLTETGAYVHATTPLAGPITLVSALRVDHHDRLDDVAVSPRLGLLVRAAPTHVLRLTYNRGYNSPDPSDLFVDIVADSLSPLPYAVRVGRVPRNGYTFRRDCGGLCMRSPFSPDRTQYFPTDATLFWPAVAKILGPDSVYLSGVPAPNGSQVMSELRALNLHAFPPRFDVVTPAEVADFGAPRRTITDALELGYKGVIGERVRLEVDAYRNRVRDLMGELVAATPNVFFERQTLEQYLANYMNPAIAAALATAIAPIPFGTVSPEQSRDPVDVLLLRRQGGAYTIWGADVGIDVRITERLTLDGSYSWLSKDSFTNVATVGDVVLSVPRTKGALGLRYAAEGSGFTARLEGRAVSSFPVISGVYNGRIDSYAVVDAGVRFPLPGISRMNVTLDAYNLLDARHREYIGAPDIGRLLVVRLQARL
jgi:iron complex outermembrane receptor protein